jgi:hypothetical protein
MSQKTKWEKEELLKILNITRSMLRCDLQRELAFKKEEYTVDINTQIKELEKKKNDILEKHNLLNIDGSRYGCDLIPLHPELKLFDENTNIERKTILQE